MPPGRIAASVAHEINNPLEAVGNIIYLLKSDTLPPELKGKYLDIAEEELSRVVLPGPTITALHFDCVSRPWKANGKAHPHSTIPLGHNPANDAIIL